MKMHTLKRWAAVFAACATMTSCLTVTTATGSAADGVTLWGDANCDGIVDMSDVVIIMQALANPNKYGMEGTDDHHITKQGWVNADIIGTSSGVTTDDALAIQEYLLKKRTSLTPPPPEA